MRQSNQAMNSYRQDAEFDEAENFESAEELDKTREMELASQLLEMTDEAGLDQFLGRLIQRAGRAAGRPADSSAGRGLRGILKGAAKKALPMLGGAVGGSSGGPAGSQLAANAGGLFGLELEGLSDEDQEFEVARRLVRFSDAAAKNLASAAASETPQQAASAAAKRHVPGMIRAALWRATMHSFRIK